uniref:Uncharacterized protein n=1 Tax=Monodelphis domestica TaxID=13616 RepID=A0A5F8GLZ4_MONDO
LVGFKPTDVPPTATVKFLGTGSATCITDLITLDTAKVQLQIEGSKAFGYALILGVMDIDNLY